MPTLTVKGLILEQLEALSMQSYSALWELIVAQTG
jgi:hypothetical protein